MQAIGSNQYSSLNSSKIGRVFLLRVLLFSSFVTLLLTGIQLYIEYKKDLNKILEQIDNSYLKSIKTAVWGIKELQISQVFINLIITALSQFLSGIMVRALQMKTRI